MSDYISKEETINTIWKTFDSFADNPSNFELEETYAIRRFCFKLQEEMKAQPTLDEKEIIRKAFERVVERLDKQAGEFIDLSHRELSNNSITAKKYLNKGFGVARAIEIVKEVGGFNG